MRISHVCSCLCLMAILVGGIGRTMANDRPFGERSILSEAATAERLRPVAQVCVEGDECGIVAAAGEATVDSAPAAVAQTPDSIYQSKCLACHAAGVAGAPKQDDTAAWQARLDTKGFDGLVATAISGINAMPPKGMCMECSDDDIKNTVEYMLKKAQLSW